jgi:RNA polymerase sigma factor (sigma-70 family)
VKPEGRKKRRRSYLPAVEALEALRLLSGQVASVLPGLPVPFELGPGAAATGDPGISLQALDAALVQSQLAELLGTNSSQTLADSKDAASGLAQLDRYLNRAWYRAGIPPQQHDDCSQAVYLTLLQNLGRDQFDLLLSDVGRLGVRDVLSRETPSGPDFFRAVDTVKKRAQRERSFQPLDAQAEMVTSPRSDHIPSDWRGALQEAIDESLSPREAALIYATIKGETPQEIASQWGVAPKTISNEKTRVIQKLRDFLVSEPPD